MDKIDRQGGGEGPASKLLLTGVLEPPYIETRSPRSDDTMGSRYLDQAMSRLFFNQIFFSSPAVNLTRGQATKYDRNNLHKVTFVAQNYIFVLFFQAVFRAGR